MRTVPVTFQNSELRFTAKLQNGGKITIEDAHDPSESLEFELPRDYIKLQFRLIEKEEEEEYRKKKEEESWKEKVCTKCYTNKCGHMYYTNYR